MAAGVCGQVAVSPHSPAPKTVKVTLADTDRLSYTVGDAILFNVVLENIGEEPIVLGISRDPEVAPKTVRPCRVVPPGVHFSVALIAMTAKGRGTLIASGHEFYGSLDAPGTTVTLQPAERARVQLTATIVPGPRMDPPLTVDLREVQMKAFVMIEREKTLFEYSENMLQVQLRMRE